MGIWIQMRDALTLSQGYGHGGIWSKRAIGTFWQEGISMSNDAAYMGMMPRCKEELSILVCQGCLCCCFQEASRMQHSVSTCLSKLFNDYRDMDVLI